MKHLHQLVVHIVLAGSLLGSLISATFLGKDTVVEKVAEIIIEKLLEAECGLG